MAFADIVGFDAMKFRERGWMFGYVWVCVCVIRKGLN